MKSLLPLIIILICVGMYFFYISPTLGDIGALSAKKAEFMSVLQKSKELKNQRDAVLTAYNNISEDGVSRLNKVIPNKFDTVTMASDISGLASRYSLTVSDIKVNEPSSEVRGAVINTAKNQLYKTIVVNFVVHGSYDSFAKFLKDLESSLHLMDVKSLGIKEAGKKNDNSLDYSVQLYTYSLR